MKPTAIWVLLLVGACATDADVAQKGRHLIVGMDAESLQTCAGIPTRTKQLDPRTELYSYEIKYERTGGADITLPLIGGGFKFGGSGSYCHALVRLVDGRVAGVIYTGTTTNSSAGKASVRLFSAAA